MCGHCPRRGRRCADVRQVGQLLAELLSEVFQQRSCFGYTCVYIGLQRSQRVDLPEPGTAAAAGVRVVRPQTATTGTPARARRPGNAHGVLPSRLCSSRLPSPVITRSAPASRSASPVNSRTTSMPAGGSRPGPRWRRSRRRRPPRRPGVGGLPRAGPDFGGEHVHEAGQGGVEGCHVLAGWRPSAGRRSPRRLRARATGCRRRWRGRSVPRPAGGRSRRSRSGASRARAAPPGGSSLPSASRSLAPSPCRTPAPPSVLALPPTPRMICRHPASSAARISSPVPWLLAPLAVAESGRPPSPPAGQDGEAGGGGHLDDRLASADRELRPDRLRRWGR